LRLPTKRPAPVRSRLGPRFVRPPPASRPQPRFVRPPQAPRPQPSADDDEIEVVYKKHSEQVAQERWVAMMKKEQLKRAQLERVQVSYLPAPCKQPEPAKQTEPQPTKKKFKPAATITFDQ
jgi:hypothetical protein